MQLRFGSFQHGRGSAINLSQRGLQRRDRIVDRDRQRLALQRDQTLDRLTTQMIEQRTWRKWLTRYVKLKIDQLVGRVAQTSQLFAQILHADRSTLRRAK